MKRIYPVFALLLVLVVNFLANYLPIAGQTTGAISDGYPSLFTPAGFTFSIWGLIYLFLIGYCIFQALPKNRSKAVFDRINLLFIINCFANAAWIFAWHYELLILSIFIMGVILITLILIYQRIASVPFKSVTELVLIKTPFSLYIGWITVAAIANISIIQSAFDWNDALMSQENWTIIKLALAGAVGAAMVIQQRDIVFGLVVAWASFGIFSNQIGSNELVVGAAGTVMVLILVSIVISWIEKMLKN
jgi:translocator protein